LSSENAVSERSLQLVFDEFSDSQPVKRAYHRSDITGLRSFNDSKSKRVQSGPAGDEIALCTLIKVVPLDTKYLYRYLIVKFFLVKLFFIFFIGFSLYQFWSNKDDEK